MSLKLSFYAGIVVAIVLISDGGTAGRAVADDVGNPVLIQWKFAEGESVAYLQDQEIVHTETYRGSSRTSVDRAVYLYGWTVVDVSVPYTYVNVEFLRLRRELRQDGIQFQLDTFNPLDQRSLPEWLKHEQDEMYRWLRSSFVFAVTPDGGTAFGDRLLVDGITPPVFQVPPAIKMPAAFTPGDSVGLSPSPVKMGEAWPIAVVDLGQGGRTTHRLVGRETSHGHDCWVIDGETIYDENPAWLRQSQLTTFQAKRESKHYFSSDLGKLVHGVETITSGAVHEDGRQINAVIRTTRTLVDPQQVVPTKRVERQVAGGERLEFWYRYGAPVNVEGRWANVTGVGAGAVGSQDDTGRYSISSVLWNLWLQMKTTGMKSVTVYDVTFDEPVFIGLGRLVSESTKEVVVLGEAWSLDDPRGQWFQEDEVTERIFQIIIEMRDGEREILYQPCFIETGKLRAELARQPELETPVPAR